MVGNNVPTKGGIPLTLDWTYVQQPTIDLDDYQDMKEPKKPRYLSKQKRRDILSRAGFDAKSLRRAHKKALHARFQRRLSNVWVPAERTFQRLSAVV